MATQSFSFTGTFTSDTDIQFFTFTLAVDTPNVTILTWSSGGGVNAAGDLIAPGGFDPLIALFNADGSEMNATVSGRCPPQNLSPAGCLDVYYPTSLPFPDPGALWPAGTYIVALTENENSATGPLNLAGDPTQSFFAFEVLGLAPNTNYTCDPATGFLGNPSSIPATDSFCSAFTATQLDGSWAVDILNVDSASVGLAGVPEPGTAALGLLGLAALAGRLIFHPRVHRR